VSDLLRDSALEKRSARRGVVAVVLEGIADGLRRDRGACEVKDAPDVVVPQEPSDERAVFDVTLQEGRTRIDCPAKPGDEIIQDYDPESRVEQLEDSVASDIACAARDKNAGPARPGWVPYIRPSVNAFHSSNQGFPDINLLR
jgi:hypothetical protein